MSNVNYKLGCCVDKECNGSTCMKLPDDESCGTCLNHPRCQSLFRCDATRTVCDFFPRKFRRVPEVSNG